ncbi:cysteine proteinase inhibitor-like [Arachis ipaensis]|uniref:Cystatin domain-containing protein n=1 Tax=Arachis hypogaea TaxID=3818 RepID=A0A444ZCY0_ARAHY|nr:cysteine proteinase inhibitor-like [Arachis ipaensis]RYR12043.1 hypothetical protein Ahy_B04g069557 [Arachis hypogaea]
MRTYCLITLFLFHFATVTTATSLMSVMLPLNLNVNDGLVIEMANFAVTEHNKRTNANLKLAQILSCKAFLSAISNTYTIELLANDIAETKKYTARLIEIFTDSTYKLQSFQLAP